MMKMMKMMKTIWMMKMMKMINKINKIVVILMKIGIVIGMDAMEYNKVVHGVIIIVSFALLNVMEQSVK